MASMGPTGPMSWMPPRQGLHLLLLLLLVGLLPFTTPAGTQVILLVGAPGEPEYGSNFVAQAAAWQQACQRASAPVFTLGLDDAPPFPASKGTNDLTRLQEVLDQQPKAGLDELWLVLIGHGTFDGKEARFNLRGPDLAATDLAVMLQPFKRPLAILNTASASAPFLNKLAASNRVVLSATRSGFEQNFTRLGRHLAETIADPSGDLDQDGQTSLLEAFLSASARVAEFYRTEGRMATEHALLDDNGDGLGTPAEWFRGLRATKRARDGAPLDGLRAHQFHLLRSPDDARLSPESRARRDALERDLAALRDRKATLPEDDYYARLESLLLDVARLYPASTNR